MKQQVFARLLIVVLCLAMLCGCGKKEETGGGEKLGTNDPNRLTATAIQLADVTAKAGETVEMKLSVTASSDLWGFSWEIDYGAEVLAPLSVEMNEAYRQNFELDIKKDARPLVIQGNGRALQNYPMTGEVATLKFRVAETAAAGEYTVTLRCKEGNNIDVDAIDIPFLPATATVTVTK